MLEPALRSRSVCGNRPISFWERLKEISMFFAGNDEVHKTARRLVKRLARARIAYAVVGGMAVNAHGYRRTTADVDVLVTPDGLAEFRRLHVKKNYVQVEGKARRFIDRKNDVTVDFLLTGMHPGSGKPGPVVFPDPTAASALIDGTPVVKLPVLIQLKLAARRHQDFADVVYLIRANDLDESFLPNLHKSLHRDFIECLEEKRREDEYEARNG